MKTQKITGLILIMFVAMLNTTCVKEGPRGPAGPTGNANVVASPWVTPTAWAGQTGNWYFEVGSSAINSDIVEYGAILAFMSIPGDITNVAVRPMPAWVDNANWDFVIPDYGLIRFTSDSENMPGLSGYTFRFILIYSSADLNLKSGKINGYKQSELQNMPYKDVCKLLGIAE